MLYASSKRNKVVITNRVSVCRVRKGRNSLGCVPPGILNRIERYLIFQRVKYEVLASQKLDLAEQIFDFMNTIEKILFVNEVPCRRVDGSI